MRALISVLAVLCLLLAFRLTPASPAALTFSGAGGFVANRLDGAVCTEAMSPRRPASMGYLSCAFVNFDDAPEPSLAFCMTGPVATQHASFEACRSAIRPTRSRRHGANLLVRLALFVGRRIIDYLRLSYAILAPWLFLRVKLCLLYTSPSPRDRTRSRMPSSA